MKTKKNRLIKVFGLLLLATMPLSACNLSLTPNKPSNSDSSLVDDDYRYSIYEKAVLAGYEGTYEEWLASIKGADGTSLLAGTADPTIDQGNNGDIYINTTSWDIFTKVAGSWTKVGNIMGPKGKDGVDGKDGKDGTDGEDGVSVVSIVKTSSQGLVDTYTITYSDGTTSTFIVTNGKDGETGVQGKAGENGHTPVITVGANGNWLVDGVDTGVAARGPKGDPGDNGKSAYELYCEAHPEYQGDEDQWLDDLINGRLGNKEVHTVHFETLGGSEIPDQQVYHGEKVSKPADPVKEDYEFVEWTYEGEPWVFFGYVVTEDMTLTAKYERIEKFGGYYDEFESHNYEAYEYLPKLHDLMWQTHSNLIAYNQFASYVRQGDDGRYSIDQVSSNIDKYEMFYTGKPVDFSQTMTREHVWPCANSSGLWVHANYTDVKYYVDSGSYVGGGSDLYHLRPCDSKVNTFRGNGKFKELTDEERNSSYEYGDGGLYTLAGIGYTESKEYSTFVEPDDNFKGDVARIIAYVYLHYNRFSNEDNYLCGNLSLTSVLDASNYRDACDLLIKWNELDPVSETEKLRNETVQGIQGNRNPFVDHPEYMSKCFGEEAQPSDEYIINSLLNSSIVLFNDEVVSPNKTFIPNSSLTKQLKLFNKASIKIQGAVYDDVSLNWSYPFEHVASGSGSAEYTILELEDEDYTYSFSVTASRGDVSVTAQYKINVNKYPYEFDELSLAEVYEINNDNNDFKLVDHETGKYVANNHDEGSPYCFVKVTGKVTYVAPDANFAIIADGDYALEVYGGAAGLGAYPAISVGNVVSVYGELSPYCGNVQLSYVEKVEYAEASSIDEPVLYSTINEIDFSGKHYWEDGLSNSLHVVTGTYVGGSLSKNVGSLSSFSRFTFSLLVGETTIKVSYDYHTDIAGDQGLFDALKNALTLINPGDTMTISGTLRFDGPFNPPGFSASGDLTSWSIVPLLAEHVGEVLPTGTPDPTPSTSNQEQALAYANEYATNMGDVEPVFVEDPDYGNYYIIEANDSLNSLEDLKTLLISYLPEGFSLNQDWESFEDMDENSNYEYVVCQNGEFIITIEVIYGTSIDGTNLYIYFDYPNQ